MEVYSLTRRGIVCEFVEMSMQNFRFPVGEIYARRETRGKNDEEDNMIRMIDEKRTKKTGSVAV
jgi:hypothetical protein